MRYPDALPDPKTGKPIYRVGRIVTPSPVAISVSIKPEAQASIRMIMEKLAHALYYREMKMVLRSDQKFFTSMYQVQRAETEDFTTYLKQLLPDLKIGQRSNIKNYGNRFTYMSGCKLEDGFFVFAAQFGYGMLCWGMILGASMELSKSNDALLKMDWRSGGCGLGSQSLVEGFEV